MKKLINATLTLLIVCGLSSPCFASLDVLMQNPDHWKVVKETRDYLIVEVVEDLSFDVEGENGTYKVNYQEGQRRVFLKGRNYRTTLRSTSDYRLQQRIEVEVQPVRPAPEN